MNPAQTAEALRVLGVHSNKRQQLAEALLSNVEKPLTLRELATSSGVNPRQIYAITERLRDLDILQPTHPIEPKDWKIIYSPRMLRSKRREHGITGPTHYTYNETTLIKAIITKAHDAEREILRVIQEETT